MFKLFGSKKNKEQAFQLTDLNNIPLHEGDHVRSNRYELGEAILKKDTEGYYYESQFTGQKVHFSLMIDAVTKRQKVEKIENN
jgi:hypothetical protein